MAGQIDLSFPAQNGLAKRDRQTQQQILAFDRPYPSSMEGSATKGTTSPTEELAEQPEPIVVSRSTLRRIRRAAGQGSPKKRRAPRYRSRRER